MSISLLVPEVDRPLNIGWSLVPYARPTAQRDIYLVRIDKLPLSSPSPFWLKHLFQATLGTNPGYF